MNIIDKSDEEPISPMTKAAKMDNYFSTKKITGSEILKIVQALFGFDLTHTPVLPNITNNAPALFDTPITVIDSYLAQYNQEELTGAAVRKIINQIFGINLDAISSLEGARISLFSKDRWVLQQEKDLFVVHTGIGDVDVRVLPTPYFAEQTGIKGLPEDLQHALARIGYGYDEKSGGYYFLNPAGEAVQDVFKGQTIKAILETIQKSYINL